MARITFRIVKPNGKTVSSGQLRRKPRKKKQ